MDSLPGDSYECFVLSDHECQDLQGSTSWVMLGALRP